MTGQYTSNPASTGEAGPFFEQHVAAYWLAQLLVRGIPPILTETNVSEVHFQTEHLGWHTDDFLIVCECPGEASVRKLAGQVKRSLPSARQTRIASPPFGISGTTLRILTVSLRQMIACSL